MKHKQLDRLIFTFKMKFYLVGIYCIMIRVRLTSLVIKKGIKQLTTFVLESLLVVNIID